MKPFILKRAKPYGHVDEFLIRNVGEFLNKFNDEVRNTGNYKIANYNIQDVDHAVYRDDLPANYYHATRFPESVEEVTSICKSLNIPIYSIDPQTLEVDCQSVDIKDLELERIPLKFRRIEENFRCDGNNLRDLEGAPKYVGGNFYCYSSNLLSLKGFPEFVGNEIDISYNALTKLEFIPDEVYGSFSCQFNKLTSLDGSPKKVGLDFSCAGNMIEDLVGGPEHVGRTYTCHKNPLLTSLVGAPKVCYWHFYAYSCPNLTSLVGAPLRVTGSFDIENCNISDYTGKPYSIGMSFHDRGNPGSDKDPNDIKI